MEKSQPALDDSGSEKENDDPRKSSISSVSSRESTDSNGRKRKGKESLVPGVRQSARLKAKTQTTSNVPKESKPEQKPEEKPAPTTPNKPPQSPGSSTLFISLILL